MSCIEGFTTGIGLGLVFFQGLWLTVRQLVRRPRRRAWGGVSRLARLILAGLVLAALSREGAGPLLAALLGFWLARGLLLRQLGGVSRGRQ
jgi:F1F0 ATPase subunit 2